MPPRKRKSAGNEPVGPSGRASKVTKTDGPQSPDPSAPDAEGRPQSKASDLEYDYDRTQLRDGRQTPGRVMRPRHTSLELRNEPAKGDPRYEFHDLHVCHKKGPNGSPSYDSAGFQLDWKAVNEWMRPKAYNKRSAVKGMSRRIERGIREKNEMYKIFFIDGKAPDKSTDTIDVENYVKDHVSKDLGVPWHQISTKHLRDWEQKGYPKQDFHQWWRQPNDEEKKRMLNMMTGASLRKKL